MVSLIRFFEPHLFRGVACEMTDSTRDSRTDLGKNFRTAYYETLGFKEEASDLNLLEDLLKADVIGNSGIERCVV